MSNCASFFPGATAILHSFFLLVLKHGGSNLGSGLYTEAHLQLHSAWRFLEKGPAGRVSLVIRKRSDMIASTGTLKLASLGISVFFQEH